MRATILCRNVQDNTIPQRLSLKITIFKANSQSLGGGHWPTIVPITLNNFEIFVQKLFFRQFYYMYFNVPTLISDEIIKHIIFDVIQLQSTVERKVGNPFLALIYERIKISPTSLFNQQKKKSFIMYHHFHVYL